LYFARAVFIPLALAVLLSFLLAPLTTRLRNWGLGRVLSALIVVHVAFLLIAIFGVMMAAQLGDLTHNLPEYGRNVHHKLESVRASGGGLVERASRMVGNISDELIPQPHAAPSSQPGEQKPVPVEIRRAPFSPFDLAQKVLGSVLNVALMGVIVIVFVIFMLIQREDLRDRLVRLLGERRVNLTTQALDDAANRLSRYLLAQFLVNAAYGTAIGAGLYFVGVPNPLLWGILTALFRYVPYLGIWVAAAMPAMLAFAVEPGWVKVPIIFGMYLGVDVLMYHFVEPPLYGSSTGISAMAILVAAVFWTWLWGPLGLLLSTPLTVCVVVIGQYVPSLEFLSVMLGDEPVLAPEIRFYQRLLAMDLPEAREIAEQFLKGKSLEELYDGVIIPALALAEEDRHQEKLDDEHQEFIFQNTRALVQDMADHSDELIAGKNSSKVNASEKPPAITSEPPPTESASVLCLPARDDADEIAALMLSLLLRKRGISARAASATAVGGERIELIDRENAQIACLAAIPPLGYTHARFLCRRLRAEFPDLKLVAAILTERGEQELNQRRPAIEADDLAASLKRALTGIVSFFPQPQSQPQPALNAA
jgi:predicted PurR-regulated permease PerM